MNTPRTNVAVASAMGGEARRIQADDFAVTILPAIVEIRAAGAATYQEVADVLNARGISTVRGGTWKRAQVQRVEARAA